MALARTPARLCALLLLAACGGDGTGPEPENVVDTSGGAVIAEQGKVSLTIPAGALTQQTQVTVQKATAPAPDPNLLPGTAYEFGPSGLQFAKPVMLELAYDEAALPAGADERRLRIFRQVGSEWVIDSHDAVANVVSNRVQGPITSFSTHAILHDPCARAPVAAGSFTGTITATDCVFEGNTLQELFEFEVTGSGAQAYRFALNSSAFNPIIGVTSPGPDFANNVVWGFALANAPGEVAFTLLAEPAPYQLFVGARAGTTGNYSASVAGTATSNALGCSEAMYVAPPVTNVGQTLQGGDCLVTIKFPADPAVDGKQTLEEYFRIKVPAGKKVTVTTTRTGGESGFSPFPTLFVGGGKVVQGDPAPTSSRTVEYSAAALQWVTLGVSSVLTGDGQGGLRYTTGTYNLTITVE